MKHLIKKSAVALSILFLTTTAYCQGYTLTINDVEFDAETGTILDCNSSEKDIIIPPSFKINDVDVAVTNIGDKVFEWMRLTSVIIPNTITTIGTRAFALNRLTSVNIPNSVLYIEAGAFRRNKLPSVTIPSSVKYIGGGAFNGNSIIEVNGNPSDGLIYARNNDGSEDLSTIISYGGVSDTIDFIPSNVTTIGDSAFFFNSLDSVILPINIVEIKDNAFRNNSLNSINIPNSVTSIGNNAFSGNNLTSVTIPSNVQLLGNYAFSFNELASANIPETITAISDGLFYNNNFTEFKIPEWVTYIGKDAFYDNELSSLIFPNSVTYIGELAFFNNSLKSINIPNNINFIGGGAFTKNPVEINGEPSNGLIYARNKDGSEDFTKIVSYVGLPDTIDFIPSSVTTIDDWAFYSIGIDSVNIPDKITQIGRNAFRHNPLSSITLPKNVIQIGDSAFYHWRYHRTESLILPINERFNTYGWIDGESNTYIGGTEATNMLTSYRIPGAYTINYGLNGGVNSLDNPYAYHTNEGVSEFYEPTKQGCNFVGWFTEDEVQVIEVPIGTEENIKLFAHWDIADNISKNQTSTIIKAYPNPVIDHLNLEGDLESAVIRVIDISGRLTLKHKAIQNKEQIDMSELDNGTYMIIVEKYNQIILRAKTTKK